jgi:hypothetical protein
VAKMRYERSENRGWNPGGDWDSSFYRHVQTGFEAYSATPFPWS